MQRTGPGSRIAALVVAAVLLLALGGAMAVDRPAAPGVPGEPALTDAELGRMPARAAAAASASETASSTSRARPPTTAATPRASTSTGASTSAGANASAGTNSRPPARTAPAKSASVPAPVPPHASAPTSAPPSAVGALKVTPSGAARGGADHLAVVEAPRPAGPAGPSAAAELALAIGTTAAASAGTILLVRRLQRRATGGEH
ncbi:hypothetical protein [Streptomyces sp. NBC_01429]|uniref:hypothetical protein n=1 Tax=Streptomyces sp. NBC_01429 TaxID=2903862 RepID=UPI002E2AEC71|nr:hypothetical protein [Streptomyces sp. NBC_01429]